MFNHHVKTHSKAAVFILAVLFFGTAPVCFSADIADFSIEWVDTSLFPVNVVYYSTTDTAGGPGKALWVPDGVRVLERGIEHRAGSFDDGNHAPAYLSLIIDSSGSMEGSLEEVLQAARSLIDQFDSMDRAELIDFDSAVVTRRAFTDNQEELREALEEIKVGGGTALYDAVAAGLDDLIPHRGMKAVVVLSDGEDENSTQYTFDKLASRLSREGVRVFPIALGKKVDAETMSSLAEISGGSFYHAASAADVEEIYREIITYLHSLHRMWYSTSFGMFDGTEREFEIEHKDTGVMRSASYTAPAEEQWSHSLTVREKDFSGPIGITPDGSYAAFLDRRTIINNRGRRIIKRRWEELYGGSLTGQYICGYVHRTYGALYRYDPDEAAVAQVDINDILAEASGSFHRNWEWYPKAISPDESHMVLCAAPGTGDYDYYFMLFDLKNRRVRWEKGLYEGEFDEPGPAAAADNGRACITQDDNLFILEPDGKLRRTMMWQDTGRRWQRLDLSADGTVCIGRAVTGDDVWVYSTDGTLIWEKVSECHEQGGYVSVSPNGKYFGYADKTGPNAVDGTGTVLFTLNGGALSGGTSSGGALSGRQPHHSPDRVKGCAIDIANSGDFVYSIGSRMYYRSLNE
jgi:VWFA-related protein